jgi:hypothetical protein
MVERSKRTRRKGTVRQNSGSSGQTVEREYMLNIICYEQGYLIPIVEKVRTKDRQSNRIQTL